MGEPWLNTGHAAPTADFAWLATVLCVIGLIVTLGGSSLGALLFLVAWGLVVAPHAGLSLRIVFCAPGIWLVPAVALASVLWSHAPGVTLRTAAQLALTVGVTLPAADLVP